MLAFPDRRIQPDRRRPTARWLLHGLRAARRTRLRRATDRGYVDRFEPALFWCALAIVVLCSVDAAWTLELLQRGARELNPLMDLLIRMDVRWFVNVKLGLTVAGVLVLALHKDFRLFRSVRARHLLYGVLAVYVALIGYEVALLTL